MNLKYKAYYGYAWDHFRSSWQRILGWTAIWFLIPTSLMLFTVSSQLENTLSSWFGLSEGGGMTKFLAVILFLAKFAFDAFRNYSIFGIAYQTSEDPDGPWIETGIQGFLHPARALGISVAIQIMTALYFLAIFLLFWFFGFWLLLNPILATIVVIGACIAYLYLFSGFATAWYQSFDDETLSGTAALRASLDYMRGKRTMVLLVLAPVILAFGLSTKFCINAIEQAYAPTILEMQMAAQTQQQLTFNQLKDAEIMRQLELGTLTPKERDRMRKMLSHDLFTQEVPVDNGDQQAYIHELAEYGLAREEFEARREQREMSPLAQMYADRPLSTGRWWLIAFALGLLDLILIAFGNILFFQVYREMQSSILDAVLEKPKENKEPDLLRSKPDASGPRAIEPDAPTPAPTQPEPESEPTPEPAPQARPESIDPGFTLKF